jgi:hypothetical protein
VEQPLGGEEGLTIPTSINFRGESIVAGLFGRGLRILEGVGGSFLAILDLRWEIAQSLTSNMICGAGIWPFVFSNLYGIAYAKDAC